MQFHGQRTGPVLLVGRMADAEGAESMATSQASQVRTTAINGQPSRTPSHAYSCAHIDRYRSIAQPYVKM